MTAGQLEYAGIRIGLEAPAPIVEAVTSELAPFFRFRPAGAGRPLLSLHVREAPLPEAVRQQTWDSGEEVAVDTSLYAHLASAGRRWRLDEGLLVRIDATATHFHFRDRPRQVSLYQPRRDLAIRDAVRAVKSLITPAVELAGGVQLHAAAVCRRRAASLILGDMWQGKTTLLLELLAEFEVDQLSCDTTVLLPRPDGSIRAHGWPSPFSVSHGTLADHAQLGRFFPPERRGADYDQLWREGRKTVLASEEVVAAFGRRLVPAAKSVATCLLVHFSPEERTRIERVGDVTVLANHLKTVYLGSRDPIYHNWHRYLVASDERIDGNIAKVSDLLFEQTEVYEMWWAPSAASLMKRVPEFARAHPHLRRILSARRVKGTSRQGSRAGIGEAG